ncbi:MAG: hypothetical protein LOD91_11400 [Limnochordales bacterium]
MAGGAAGTPGGTGGSPSGGRGQRLVGIDVARAVAIIGMFMVHMGPTHQPGVAGALYALPHGRASVLFVLLAGVGVSLLARSALGLGEVRRRLAWRAAVLFPLGLGLQALEHRVLVILPVYAALFVLAMLAVAWDDRRLLRLAAACGAVGPGVFLYGRIPAPAVFSRIPSLGTNRLGRCCTGWCFRGRTPSWCGLPRFLWGCGWAGKTCGPRRCGRCWWRGAWGRRRARRRCRGCCSGCWSPALFL